MSIHLSNARGHCQRVVFGLKMKMKMTSMCATGNRILKLKVNLTATGRRLYVARRTDGKTVRWPRVQIDSSRVGACGLEHLCALLFISSMYQVRSRQTMVRPTCSLS